MENKTQKFIEKAKETHSGKYDYSKVKYINNKTKVCIICPIHGEFWQTPDKHLNRKQGCPYCSGNARSNTESFINKAIKIHGNKYNYSKVNYVSRQKNICIICPTHGEFWQKPSDHLRGEGCPKCGYEIISKKKCSNTQKFIENAINVHGNEFDYSKVNYVNAKTKVCIICPIHGEFLQTPNNHLRGEGCPICKASSLERFVKSTLDSKKIVYIREYRLGRQRIDFFIPSKNIAIECQGEQHFIPKFVSTSIKHKNEFENCLKRDFKKFQKCAENNYTIFYFTEKTFIKDINIYSDFYNNIYTKENVFFDIDDIINEITKR